MQADVAEVVVGQAQQVVERALRGATLAIVGERLAERVAERAAERDDRTGADFAGLALGGGGIDAANVPGKVAAGIRIDQRCDCELK